VTAHFFNSAGDESQSRGYRRVQFAVKATLNQTWFVLGAVAGLLLLTGSGCARKSEPPSVAPPEPPATANAVPTESASTAPVPTPPVPAATPSAEIGGNIPAVEMLNSAINDYASAYGKAPKDLNELVKMKFITAVPPPPAGKKFVIDPVKRQVMIVN
jgi:hypothetical protein